MIRDAYILAGGNGTRLKSYTDRPKSLLKIYEEPFILDLLKWCILNQLLNIKIIIAKHQTEIFEKELENYSELGFLRKIKIELIEEDKKMGTAGWLLKNINFLPEQFIVMNADTYYFENIINEIHEASLSSYSVIFGYEENMRKDSGFINLDENNLVTSFNEKLVTSKISSSGCYVIKRNHLQKIKNHISTKQENISLELEAFPILCNEKLLKCFPKSFNKIYDFGTPSRIGKAKNFIKRNQFKWLFVDRDNTLNIDKNGYTHKVKDLKIIEKIIPFLKGYQKDGFFLCICTNQSGIGRNYYLEKNMKKFNKFLIKKLEKNYQVFISELVFCPHHPEQNCECRKPKTGMIDSIGKIYSIDRKNSIIIGDAESDENLAKNVGITFFRFKEF